MNRAFLSVALLSALLACAHARTPEHEALVARGECTDLLKAADSARAEREPALAAELASACPQDKLDALVSASTPEEALLWCGRAKAAGDKPACAPATVDELTAKLHPHLTIGPPDAETPLDPLLSVAFDEVGKELNLSWDPVDPDVIVGRLSVSVEHLTSRATTSVADAKGTQQRVPATQHRFVARAEAQVELAGKTRTLRATEEARDYTWEAKQTVGAKFDPVVPPEPELRRRAALAWMRALGKALASAPPENVNVSDVKGCVAYGLSLNFAAGNSTAAARGLGDPSKVRACEHLLGEPANAGIPVP